MSKPQNPSINADQRFLSSKIAKCQVGYVFSKHHALAWFSFPRTDIPFFPTFFFLTRMTPRPSLEKISFAEGAAAWGTAAAAWESTAAAWSPPPPSVCPISPWLISSRFLVLPLFLSSLLANWWRSPNWPISPSSPRSCFRGKRSSHWPLLLLLSLLSLLLLLLWSPVLSAERCPWFFVLKKDVNPFSVRIALK